MVILAKLNKVGVLHIPKILRGGVIEGERHSTLADKYSENKWGVGPRTKLTPQVHYRFIKEDTGKSPAEFKDAKELTVTGSSRCD